jgi:hypothetical protein
MFEGITDRMLLGAALVVLPVALVVWFVIINRRQPQMFAGFRAFLKSKTAVERTIAHTMMTLLFAAICSTFAAGLQLLNVPVPAQFRYWPGFWMPIVASAIGSIAFVALFDVKAPKISEDWLDWKRDDETKGSPD